MEKFDSNELWKLSIYALRLYAREIGVASPTTRKKRDLIQEIILVQEGKKVPYFCAKGRPPKESNRDRLLSEIENSKLKKDIKKHQSPLPFWKINYHNMSEVKKEMRKQFVKAMNLGSLFDLEYLQMVLFIIANHLRKKHSGKS